MSYEKLYRLVEGISAKTETGNVDWETTINEGVYQTSLSNYSIQIRSENSYNSSDEDYILTILDAQGNVIEEVSDVSLNQNKDANNRSHNNYFMMFKNLYGSARRQALGVEKVIDTLLDQFANDENNW